MPVYPDENRRMGWESVWQHYRLPEGKHTLCVVVLGERSQARKAATLRLRIWSCFDIRTVATARS